MSNKVTTADTNHPRHQGARMESARKVTETGNVAVLKASGFSGSAGQLGANGSAKHSGVRK